MLKILIVDDDQGLRFSLREILQEQLPCHVLEAVDGDEALSIIHQTKIDLVILDVDMPGALNGLDVLKAAKEHDPSIIVLILTAFANISDAIMATKEGAFHYLEKPVNRDALLLVIQRAIEANMLVNSIAASSPILLEDNRQIIGNTIEMKRVYSIIYRLSKVDTPVLIRGASGTGKELVARAIHYNSTRKDGKFVAINCSAIPESLFESELFGHEKGSFTGAAERKIGKFQYCEGGTLFLDELGDMPISMQAKLLRVLQEKVFTPVGALHEIESNVRIIAATHRPLEKMIEEVKFREDLFYRLNVMPIFLPSLCERTEDLHTLVQSFIKKFNLSHKRKILDISVDALKLLKKYKWPGNIRELENVVEHSFILENTNILQIRSLPDYILKTLGIQIDKVVDSQMRAAPAIEELVAAENNAAGTLAPDSVGLASPGSPDGLDFLRQKESFEKDFILKALKQFGGRINQTALHANIPKKTLLRKIEKYGINVKEL